MAVKAPLNKRSAEVLRPFTSVSLALASLLFADYPSGGAWAQDRSFGQPPITRPAEPPAWPSPSGAPVQNVRPSGQPLRSVTRPADAPVRQPTSGGLVQNVRPSGQALRPVTRPADAAVRQPASGALAQELRGSPIRQPAQTTPEIDSASVFGGKLASCDKDKEDNIQFALPVLNGEIKLDSCYRGRQQLVCRFDAIVAEGKSLSDEFTRVVEAGYPEVKSLEAICKIDFDSLIKDAASGSEFAKRFGATRSEYDARISCANKVKQSIQDVTLPQLAHAPEVLKSITDVIDQEISRVSTVQEQISGLAAKLELSHKSIAVLQKLHRAMCLKSKPGV
jgi:hypothetical protein